MTAKFNKKTRAVSRRSCRTARVETTSSPPPTSVGAVEIGRPGWIIHLLRIYRVFLYWQNLTAHFTASQLLPCSRAARFLQQKEGNRKTLHFCSKVLQQSFKSAFISSKGQSSCKDVSALFRLDACPSHVLVTQRRRKHRGDFGRKLPHRTRVLCSIVSGSEPEPHAFKLRTIVQSERRYRLLQSERLRDRNLSWSFLSVLCSAFVGSFRKPFKALAARLLELGFWHEIRPERSRQPGINVDGPFTRNRSKQSSKAADWQTTMPARSFLSDYCSVEVTGSRRSHRRRVVTFLSLSRSSGHMHFPRFFQGWSADVQVAFFRVYLTSRSMCKMVNKHSARTSRVPSPRSRSSTHTHPLQRSENCTTALEIDWQVLMLNFTFSQQNESRCKRWSSLTLGANVAPEHGRGSRSLVSSGPVTWSLKSSDVAGPAACTCQLGCTKRGLAGRRLSIVHYESDYKTSIDQRR